MRFIDKIKIKQMINELNKEYGKNIKLCIKKCDVEKGAFFYDNNKCIFINLNSLNKTFHHKLKGDLGKNYYKYFILHEYGHSQYYNLVNKKILPLILRTSIHESLAEYFLFKKYDFFNLDLNKYIQWRKKQNIDNINAFESKDRYDLITYCNFFSYIHLPKFLSHFKSESFDNINDVLNFSKQMFLSNYLNNSDYFTTNKNTILNTYIFEKY